VAVTLHELADLVGRPVDLERGGGYAARPAEPGLRYATALVALLPRPTLDADPMTCMRRGLTWLARVGQQLRPDNAGRSCCWLHAGDWHQASRLAIAMAAEARGRGLDDYDTAAYALAQAEAGAFGAGWQLEAAASLFGEPVRAAGGYMAGRHRVKAMLDAGVRRTLVVRWDQRDPGSRWHERPDPSRRR